jgi:methenyltetrahydrofolate cyclohydrolase
MFHKAHFKGERILRVIKDISLQAFLDELASGAPTPGGGGVAAMSGAMGAALVSMVCKLTIGKKKYAAVEVEMTNLLAKSEELRQRLIAMISADVEAFDQVMAALAMSRETEAEMNVRTEAVQAALKEATRVPLACALACAEVIKISKPVVEKGNTNAISDAGVAALAAHAGLRSAALNVYINLGGIKDDAFVANKGAELEAIIVGIDARTEDVYQLVKRKL